MSISSEHNVFLVPSQFPSIQEAIRAIARPTTIMVSPGVYEEDLLIVDKPAVVISTTRFGRRGVTMTGVSSHTVVRIESSSVYLSGIEIRSNGRARALSAIESSVALQECLLAGNRVIGELNASGGGMSCQRSKVRVQKSTVVGNSVHASGGEANGAGLFLTECKVEIAGSTIQANAVYGAVEARGGGIWCEASDLRVWRSRITDNALLGPGCEGAGIYFKDSTAQLGGSVITGNGTAHGRGGGVFVNGRVEGVVVHRNTVVRQNYPDDFIADGIVSAYGGG
jgi:hypothetical protein